MGQKIVAAARAVGILAVVWGVAMGVAFFADALPSQAAQDLDPDAETETESESAPESEAPEELPAVAEAPSEPEAPASAEGATIAAPSDEAGDAPSEPSDAAPSAPSVVGPARHTKVCANVEHARVGVGDILGGGNVEQIVICGREAHVLSVHDGGLARLARLTLEGDTQVRMASPVVADVDGDGLHDLVLGWTFLDAEGGPDGGTLRWVAGDASGGFGESHVLQPLSVVDLATAELDGRPGADLVALHWADGFGRRPSEAWVFGGGPSPRRLARRRLRADGVAAAVADVNGDGHLDLVTVDAEGAQIADGDGTGRFPRFRSIPLEAGRGVVVIPAAPAPPAETGDEDGSDAEEAEVLAASPDRVVLIGEIVMALSADGEPTTLAAPHGILRALPLPGGDILAMTRQRVVRISDGAERTVVDLPGTLRPIDIAILPTSQGPAILVLGRTASGWEIVEAPLSESVVRVEPGVTAAEVVSAPLVLSLDLR